MTGDNVLLYNWYLLGVKKNSSHADTTGSWYFLGVLFEIFDEHNHLSYMGAPQFPNKWMGAIRARINQLN